MLLLYQSRNAREGVRERIYIPLCFYFIIPATFHNRTTASFTFHYASTLSKPIFPFPSFDVHLHSTMLLLYLPGRWLRLSLYADLHSTMLLLYLCPPSAISNCLWIYIPLCFYFIPFRYIFVVSPSNLHSTMLLLYRYEWETSVYNVSNLHSTMLLLYLTFGQSRCFRVFHLHSTMLLLYRGGIVYKKFAELYLHSTMLLLYLKQTGSKMTFKKKFTFHYASTLSFFPPLRSVGTTTIYIPLCFYFISSAYSRQWTWINLHSTMLLLYPQNA